MKVLFPLILLALFTMSSLTLCGCTSTKKSSAILKYVDAVTGATQRK